MMTNHLPPISARCGVRILQLMMTALLLASCTTVPRTDFGVDQQAEAQPVGFSDVRFDADNLDQSRALGDEIRSNLPNIATNGLQMLVLSGGGSEGGYGAGVLQGWSRSGK